LVLVVQLMSYMLADIPAYVGCVLGSCAVSLLVPLGPGLPVAAVLSVVLIPLAALMSGCLSASLLQWLGDRLGALRGRLACVGCTSVALSFVTYALVIAPIIVGMGFFAVAATGVLSVFYVLPGLLPRTEYSGPSWLLPFVAYSISAVGAVVAVVVMGAGAVLAPTVGFMVRPALVAVVYRLTAREREPGEVQWPPSLVGERADLWWPLKRQEVQLDEAPPESVR
jgi:hypothetical protein